MQILHLLDICTLLNFFVIIDQQIWPQPQGYEKLRNTSAGGGVRQNDNSLTSYGGGCFVIPPCCEKNAKYRAPTIWHDISDDLTWLVTKGIENDCFFVFAQLKSVYSHVRQNSLLIEIVFVQVGL